MGHNAVCLIYREERSEGDRSCIRGIVVRGKRGIRVGLEEQELNIRDAGSRSEKKKSSL